MTKQGETRIVVCDKCGIRTRHQWQQWERKSLLLSVTGHVRLVEGWVCTKCGRQSRVRRIGVAQMTANRKASR